MNELALIFDRLGLDTAEVLEAAGTKWNFLPFRPGLVGGHCIGVDPYYLTSKAEEVGYHPQVILAGRRINDGMGAFVAQKTIKLLSQRPSGLGRRAGRRARGHLQGERRRPAQQPRARHRRGTRRPSAWRCCSMTRSWSPARSPREYGLDAAGLARTARPRRPRSRRRAPGLSSTGRPLELVATLKPDAVVVDVKSFLDPADLPGSVAYWSL